MSNQRRACRFFHFTFTYTADRNTAPRISVKLDGLLDIPGVNCHDWSETTTKGVVLMEPDKRSVLWGASGVSVFKETLAFRVEPSGPNTAGQWYKRLTAMEAAGQVVTNLVELGDDNLDPVTGLWATPLIPRTLQELKQVTFKKAA